jgi:hypothetical protein
MVRHLNLLAGFVALVTTLFIAAIATAGEQRTDPGSYQPPEGYARLVVLRPVFFETGRADKPWLFVGSSRVQSLAADTYTYVTVAPGAYEIAVTPNDGETNAWKARTIISVEAGQVYFLAVWNEVVSGVGSFGRVTPHLGLLGALMDQSSRTTSVRFEMIPEIDAMMALQKMSYVAPNTQRFEKP